MKNCANGEKITFRRNKHKLQHYHLPISRNEFPFWEITLESSAEGKPTDLRVNKRFLVYMHGPILGINNIFVVGNLFFEIIDHVERQTITANIL